MSTLDVTLFASTLLAAAGAFAQVTEPAADEASPPAAVVPPSEDVAGQQIYVVDAARSDVHWLVYRAGAFGRFGHNHVVSAGELAGRVVVDRGELAKSTFELEIPVASLVVDDPRLRSGLGDDFSSVPSEKDVEGTRRNMLSERVLDGERHALLRVTGVGPIGTASGQTLTLTVHLLGREIALTVPTSVTIADGELVAAGEFRLTHDELGMQPFSVMGGALQVGNPLDFAYRVIAVAEPGPTIH